MAATDDEILGHVLGVRSALDQLAATQTDFDRATAIYQDQFNEWISQREPLDGALTDLAASSVELYAAIANPDFPDPEMLDLCNTMSSRIFAVADAQRKFDDQTASYNEQYLAWQAIRAPLDLALFAYERAKGALEEGINSRAS
jgi:hypothetical protein